MARSVSPGRGHPDPRAVVGDHGCSAESGHERTPPSDRRLRGAPAASAPTARRHAQSCAPGLHGGRGPLCDRRRHQGVQPPRANRPGDGRRRRHRREHRHRRQWSPGCFGYVHRATTPTHTSCGRGRRRVHGRGRGTDVPRSRTARETRSSPWPDCSPRSPWSGCFLVRRSFGGAPGGDGERSPDPGGVHTSSSRAQARRDVRRLSEQASDTWWWLRERAGRSAAAGNARSAGCGHGSTPCRPILRICPGSASATPHSLSRRASRR